MKAHKVPATYYKGWKAKEFKNSFYVFYKENITSEGHLKKFKDVKKITKEHSFFMEEDFYNIDLETKGIVYKLKDEINDFLKLKKFSISFEDSVSDDEYADNIIIDSSDNFINFFSDIDLWKILDLDGKEVAPCKFKSDLNEYVSFRVGTKIEIDYFSEELEPKWNTFKNYLEEDIRMLHSNENITIRKIDDFLEFVVVQYLRIDDRIEKSILPGIGLVKKIFKSNGLSDEDLLYFENDGLLSYEPYFYGILLDAARGNNTKILENISELKDKYLIDILEVPKGIYYLTSTNPLIVSKENDSVKEEMLFPINQRLCARFRKKNASDECGKYIKQTIDEVKIINKIIIKESTNIVMSNLKYIVGMI